MIDSRREPVMYFPVIVDLSVRSTRALGSSVPVTDNKSSLLMEVKQKVVYKLYCYSQSWSLSLLLHTAIACGTGYEDMEDPYWICA